MTKVIIQSIIIVILLLFLIFTLFNPIINYPSLAKDVANGKTYILYKGALTPALWGALILIGILSLVMHKKDSILNHVTLLIISAWPAIITLNFFIYGYVVGDQPRLEFALGSLIVSSKISLMDASKASSYFNWPSTWLLEGVFSNILGITPFEAPPYLMLVIYLLLGLALIGLSRGLSELFLTNGAFAILSLLAYAIFNPYKILHFSPQIYALTIFIIFLRILIKDSIKAVDYLTLFILSASIITSHPLTSIVIVSIAAAIILFNLIKSNIWLRKSLMLTLTVIVLFVSWNLNYENLIKSVINELLERPQIQPLSPVASRSLYSVDSFFKFMAFYRYLSLIILLFLSIPSMTLLLISSKRKHTLKIKIIAIGAGTLIGTLLLNFIPGSFLHRFLFFISTLVCAFVPTSISVISKKVRKSHSLKFFLGLLLMILPLLAHIAVLEFITNNNPVVSVIGPHELSLDAFVATHYDFRKCIEVPSGSLAFYTYILNYNLTARPCLRLSGDIAVNINIQPSDYASAREFIKRMYVEEIFVVSPRERFIYYAITLNDFLRFADNYLNSDYLKVYDNEVYRLYEHAS
ncbi:MAG: hypothetical protein LM583_06775 [Desulfurococcaceae archaeon]|nr:hypothetical protein [Desulfurococcaceae archaeon]